MNVNNPVVMIALIGAAIVIAAAFIAIAVWIIGMLYRAMKAVPEEHRKMAPWLVWLLLIPFFNLIWNFFVFLWIPASYESYFKSMGRNGVGTAEHKIGLAYPICSVCGWIPLVGPTSGGGFPVVPPQNPQ